MTTPPSAATSCSPPRRFIFNDADMEHFLASPAKKELMQVTAAMGRACAADTTLENAAEEYEYDPANPLMGLSPPLAALHGSLVEMTNWLAECPPYDRNKARFGNPAFRHWHQRLTQRSASIVQCLLRLHKQYDRNNDTNRTQDYYYDISILQQAADQGKQAAKADLDVSHSSSVALENEEDRPVILELCAYLNAAFGHPVRLDYGTGHECSFHVFLYSLLKLGCFGSTPQEPPTVVRLKAATLSLYSAYLQVARQLQTDYMLEPAGSHGVWGLDDYHCLPFYFGACQLQNCQEEEYHQPRCIHDDSILARDGNTYLYFGCIRYIKSLKKGCPFFESSPMLNDISALPSWQKVASGLLRLFEGEVLNKRQVVQHFTFGNIFSANWTPSEVQQQAPSETFRSPFSNAQAVGPMVQAPWAAFKNESGEDGGHLHLPATSSSLAPPMAATRAPWATATNTAGRNDASLLSSHNNNDDDDDHDIGFAPTRAPWAK